MTTPRWAPADTRCRRRRTTTRRTATIRTGAAGCGGAQLPGVHGAEPPTVRAAADRAARKQLAVQSRQALMVEWLPKHHVHENLNPDTGLGDDVGARTRCTTGARTWAVELSSGRFTVACDACCTFRFGWLAFHFRSVLTPGGSMTVNGVSFRRLQTCRTGVRRTEQRYRNGKRCKELSLGPTPVRSGSAPSARPRRSTRRCIWLQYPPHADSLRGGRRRGRRRASRQSRGRSRVGRAGPRRAA